MINIVTVTRNNLKGLRNTVGSIESQSSAGYRWIVIDGKSDDGSVDFINGCSVKPFYFVSEPDGGIFDAMNKGIRACESGWTLFLNAGDVFADSLAIDTMSSMIEQSPGVDILYFSCRLRLPNGILITRTASKPSYINYALPTRHQAILVRQGVLRETEFLADYPVSGDYANIAEAVGRGARAASSDRIVAIFEHATDAHSYQHRFEIPTANFRAQRDFLRLGLVHRCFNWVRLALKLMLTDIVMRVNSQ